MHCSTSISKVNTDLPFICFIEEFLLFTVNNSLQLKKNLAIFF